VAPFPNTSAGWGPANSQVIPEGKAVRFDSALPSAYPISTERNRHSSWDPSTAHAYRGRPNLNDQETQSHPNTPFISPLSPPSGPSFYTPNHWGAGVSADYHNSGWSPADDRRDRSHSHAGAAFRYGAPADYHNSGWSPADDRRDRSHSHAGAAFRYGAPAVYPMLRSPGNDREWVTPSGAGAALRHDGVRNAGAAWGPVTPWVGMAMATRDDETVTSTHQITNQSWDVHVYSQKLQITGERLRHYQIVRSKLRFESQLTDLFSGSLGVWLRSFFSKKLQD